MISPVTLPGGDLLRPLQSGDAPALLDGYTRNRERLRPLEPARPDSFWTLAGQQGRLDSLLRQQDEGTLLACAVFRGDRIVASLTLNTIVRGPFRSASIGYWVDGDEEGRGLATAAVAAICGIADEQLDLHRIEASVFPSNLRSQRVLAKNGFQQIGRASTYLYLDEHWQDALLFQRVLNHRPPGSLGS
jgi:ribosomal-protein-alanine N-acetyltransferase